MQGPTDEASTPTVYVINRQLLGVTVRRKKRPRTTRPWPAAAGNPALPPPPPQEDEGLPVAKRARLQGPASDAVVNAHAAETLATDSPDDTPTDPVTPVAPAVFLPCAVASRAPRRNWKAKEDAKLLEAVQKHGDDWVKVAAMVPDRTDRQCRERWVHSLDPANGKKRGKWTPAEDENLMEAVKTHGNNWVKAAAMVPDRTDRQCRKRWVQTLDPANGKNLGKWSTEEDEKLIEAVKKHGKKWAAAALMVPGRTDQQCRQRWFRTLDPANGNKGKWSTEEDEKLAEAVNQHGKKWVAVALMVPGRTNKQCRERWLNHLDPDRASNTVE
jgi:S-ribosylhomocysteine lyase LuxS involved in autoinducer biosynthesis